MDFKPIEQYPHRICLDIADHLAPFIKDKVVCDLGCGAGDLLEFLRIRQLCREVKGMEIRPERYQKSKKYVQLGDILSDPMPEADVYLVWLFKDFPFTELFSRLSGPKTIIYLASHEEIQKEFSQLPGMHPRIRIDFSFDESKYGSRISEKAVLTNPTWRLKGERFFVVYDYDPSRKE